MLQNFVHLKLALPQIILVTRLAEVKLQRTFLSGPAPASFCLFSFFSHTNFTEKTVGIRGIQTRIIGVEGEHADHLTTTTAQLQQTCPIQNDACVKSYYLLLDMMQICRWTLTKYVKPKTQINLQLMPL